MPRFVFDRAKSRAVKLKHGLSLSDAQQIFEQTYLVDQRSYEPDQYRAIGWCGGRLCSVIFEIRRDESEYYHLVTAWKATKEEEQFDAENT